jgi:tRNA U34 5-carboxymethylaminomethyl modifying enzyme MnmG/GidA
MAQRTDTASINFGGRVRQLEKQAAKNQAEISDLKKNSLDDKQKQLLNQQHQYQKDETLRASSMLINPNTSVETLQSIDTAQLPTAQRQLIQDEIASKQYTQPSFEPMQFTPEAQERMRNFEALKARRFYS